MKLFSVSALIPNVTFGLNIIILLGLVILIVTGCTDESKPATQIVAKVNDDEITVHQLNSALAKLPAVAPENLAQVKLDLVGKLVNEQLTVQQAMLLKLDRSSDVMMQIEAAKREILTKAYLKEVIAGLPKPSAEESQQFYEAHPELFSERHIYSLQQITMPAPHPTLAEVKKLAADKSMTEIVATLKQNKILFSATAATRAAEQIPLGTLSVIAQAEDGQIHIIESPQAITIARVERAQLNPVDQASALQRIPQYLMNEQAKHAINSKLSQLRAASNIVYMNEFSGAAKLVPTLPSSAPKPTTQSQSIEKGIAGIH